jgi:DNA-binding NarL/FixJ family response regulator
MLKKTAPSKMLDAIKELCEGGAPMSSQIARKVVAVFQQKATPDVSLNYKALDSLTKREKEVLEMLSGGLLYKEIADKIGISAETVKKHLYKIYDKLHVSNRVEAVNKYFGR